MASLESTSKDNQDQYLQYRAVSMSAMIATVLAVMSLPSLLFGKLLVLPALGLIVSVYSLVKIGPRRHEFVGFRLSQVSVVVCFTLLVGGSSRAAYVYATEVPENYTRISFSDLQPNKQYPQMPIPPSAIELDGMKVFVTGYVHPGVDRRRGIKQFVLVPDMKTCCFGGQPELTDMIEVTLTGADRINYSFSRRKLAGTFKVTPYKKAVAGLDGVYYQLEVDQIVR